jgi:2-polyprenyl-3-methyl-5-hydroxy-6-metoxy-1,4-benzoquinol methylase
MEYAKSIAKAGRHSRGLRRIFSLIRSLLFLLIKTHMVGGQRDLVDAEIKDSWLIEVRATNPLLNKNLEQDDPPLDSSEKIMKWISTNVPGKTFADVGGIGVDSINERVTLASKAGALSSTMIDIRPEDFYEWGLFHKKCEQENVKDYRCIAGIDIHDPLLLQKVGQYDFVHCTGIVYHLPNPVAALENLRHIVKEYLIINTVIVPPRIETEEGCLEFKGSVALFMPGLSSRERQILNSYYLNKYNFGVDYMAPALDAVGPACPWFEDGKPTCWPYWFLFTPQSFAALVRMVGFEILDLSLWENHALTLFVRKLT